MHRNPALRKGLGSVIGLNFEDLPAERQVEMMRGMTCVRYNKVSKACVRAAARHGTVSPRGTRRCLSALLRSRGWVILFEKRITKN